MGMQSKRFSNKALLMLTEHPWRGNIREMENLVKYIMTTVDGPIIEYKDLPWHILGTEPLADTRPEEEESSMERQPNASLPPEDFSLASFTWDELEKQYILDLLEKKSLECDQGRQTGGGEQVDFRFTHEAFGHS